MQPPPRKGNYAKYLKNLHSEQINKLILKNQHECDLLEDIRTFTIKRSAIEKSYSEALLKISSAYLNKKIPNIPDIKLDGGEEKWNMWSVWRTVLEENEKLARARLAAVEVFQQQIADDAKILRAHKLQMAKKVSDQIALVQKELQTCVQDLDKTKKFYFDEEHCAHDVRDKARDIEEKLKKKKGSFFQSITSLQKNSQKVSSKREQLEEKSTGARNDYLLSLAAANAHQTRYFVIDLQLGLSTIESGVYDKVAEYLTLMGRTELLTCSAMQNSFTIIRDQAKQLTREYNLKCCYLYYPVLKQHIQYDFEPCDNDPVDHITADHDSSAATLSKEARRWAGKIARENNIIKDCVSKLQKFNELRESGQKTDPNDPNGPDLEMKVEEMKQNIRVASTAKAKAEARIECLRKGGVNVDEWLQEAESSDAESSTDLHLQSLQETQDLHDLQRSSSSLSDHPSYDYDCDFSEPDLTATLNEKGTKVEDDAKMMHQMDERHSEIQEVDAAVEQERRRIEELTAGWDDPTKVDWGAEAEKMDVVQADVHMPQDASQHTGPLPKCTALYSYSAQNPDELSILENEQLEVVGEGDGDGWVKARNYRGEEGYVPYNYIDIEREHSATTPGLQTQISFSSVDYTVDAEEDNQPQTETTQSPEQISVISLPIQKASNDMEMTPTYCVALYDYEGEGGEELTFEEGQIIKVLSKCAHSIDDGWWQGELDGHIGNFPSLVVEDCDEFGEPLTNQWDETPPPSAPPVFTPPDIPGAFKGQVEFMEDDTPFPDHPKQPAPILELDETEADDEDEDEAEDEAGHDSSSHRFSMELTRDQHQQYGTQFQEGEGEPANNIPAMGIPSLAFSDEDGNSVKPADAVDGNEDNLNVATIVITAATPMMEEPAQPFPPPEETPKQQDDVIKEEEEEEEHDEQEVSKENDRRVKTKEDVTDEVPKDQDIPKEPVPIIEEVNDLEKKEEQHCEVDFEELDNESSQTPSPAPPQDPPPLQPPPPPPEPSSSQAEASTSSTVSTDPDVPKQVVGGRASIPDELEPHQLARLQDLKESNA